MRFRSQDTIFSLVPGVTIALILFSILTGFINNLEKMQNSLITYAECSREIMDKAFMGEFENFSECYINKLNTTKINCDLVNNTIICEYDNKKYIYEIGK